MSATSDLSPAKAKTLRKALAEQLAASTLPGETGLAEEAVESVASFLLEAAQKRRPSRSVLTHESDTSERRFRIAIINDDMPFLVDSVAATITAQGLGIEQLLHPIVPIARDDEGLISAIGEGAKGAQKESLIYIETRRVDARQRKSLLSALRQTLGDVRASVADWPKLLGAMQESADILGESDSGQLLEWLESGMLTQLGHLVRSRSGEVSDALGICRKSAGAILADASYERAFDYFDKQSSKTKDMLVVKANQHSNVHRRVPLDVFLVPIMDGKKVTGLSVHAGVWTSAALAAPPSSVPILRDSLAHIASDMGFDPQGHAGKALAHAFTALPRDLLVSFERDDVARLVTAMMSLGDRPRPRVVLLQSPLARHVFAFVWLPRDNLSTQVRLQIEDLLTQSTGLDMLSWTIDMDGSPTARLQFLLDSRTIAKMPDASAIEAQLAELLRGWGEAVENELAKSHEGSRVAAIVQRYAESFPPGYRLRYGPAEAALDIAQIHAIANSETPEARSCRLYKLASDTRGDLRLKIYHISGRVALSDAVPVLENFGFRVLSEVPTRLDGARLGTIHEYTLVAPQGASIDALLKRVAAIETAIAEVLNGHSENDPFNRLVVTNGLSAHQTVWLRAIYRYLRQTGINFTIYPVVDALERASDVTAAMVALFTSQHDPHFDAISDEDREAAIEAARSQFQRGLAKVSAINDDRLLRLYRAVIDATLRTNAFAPAAEEALAFKIQSDAIPGLPKPVPWREIFVYSRRVEGIHLRSGAVARGGLRWSDRRDDYRTEVLGLMKAQKVKNAVIVPSGAKGGFYPKELPSPAVDRDAWFNEGRESYKVFIRTLLSVTDNIVSGKVVHPKCVRVHDGEDPYFVVAADKGTATFSDTANALAEEAGFWLDDAFASGGSNGYDHKAMGITARGAWVSVQRHFLEQGVDVQKDTIRVAGCGDMSGDVFGNGMLLSKAIKLVAAFDHRHIFIDPNPDPAKSWTERKRLFDLPRSSWEDYDAKLISKGGGVYSRSSKSIKLSKTAQDMLGLENQEIGPDALISAILKAEIDLLWFGGIGTYIKSAQENHVEVGDPANDTIRVDADEVGAKVIGEGANLGITQAGRIAFSLGGGRINTDFIDNSAGVDCSDNEVNIKIALAAAKRDGEITTKARNALLARMTDEVGEIVLEDNRLQALALSIAEAGGASASASYVRLIEQLEGMGALDRRTEGLADGEAYARRAADGKGLTRPELAVLLSSCKLALQDAIEASGLPDDEVLQSNLVAMFPEAMQDKFKDAILDHQLRRELVATDLANRIVNRLGLIHAFELPEEEGVALSDVAAAFVVVERLYDLKKLWADIDAAPMEESARISLLDRLAAAVGNLMSDVLRTTGGRVEAGVMVKALQPGVSILREGRADLLQGSTLDRSQELRAEFVAVGAPGDLAGRVADLFDFDGSVGIANLALQTKIEPATLTHAFADIGTRIGIDWAQGVAAHMSPSNVWERLLVDGLARDFQHMRTEFLRRLTSRKAGRNDPQAAIAKWAQSNAPAIAQFRSMLARAQNSPPVAPAALAQIAAQARNLLER